MQQVGAASVCAATTGLDMCTSTKRSWCPAFPWYRSVLVGCSTLCLLRGVVHISETSGHMCCPATVRRLFVCRGHQHPMRSNLDKQHIHSFAKFCAGK